MTVDRIIEELIAIVSEKNPFQAKSLSALSEELSPEERESFCSLINVYLRQGDSLEHLADCYLKFIQDIMEEQLYFVRNKRYHYSQSEDVNAFFYQNPEYMEYYMKGLAISTYLLDSHRSCRQWFMKNIENISGGGMVGRWRRTRRLLRSGHTPHELPAISGH